MKRITSLTGAVPRGMTRAGSVLKSIWLWRWILSAVTLAATLVVFGLSLKSGLDVARRQARQRLVIAEAVLRAAIARYDYLPTVLALDTQVQALLADVDAPDRVATVNAKFAAIATASSVAAIYLMDPSGLTRGASNWNQPLSFVGTSYAYRPYFTAAKAKGVSHYFGIGTTTGVPGLFIGKAVPGGTDGSRAWSCSRSTSRACRTNGARPANRSWSRMPPASSSWPASRPGSIVRFIASVRPRRPASMPSGNTATVPSRRCWIRIRIPPV